MVNRLNKISLFLKISLIYSCCIFFVACACRSTIQIEGEIDTATNIPIYEKYIQIQSYQFENQSTIQLNFSITNPTKKTICLYRSLFESERTFLYQLLVRRNSFSEPIPREPVGFIDEMPPTLVALKPNETRFGSLYVGRDLDLQGLQANFRVFGNYCEHNLENVGSPDFFLDSGWFDLREGIANGKLH